MTEIGTFLEFVTESRAKQGEQAEIDLYNLLKKYNKLPSTQKKPAGFSADEIDLSFLDKKNDTHLLEVKYGLPDFGQIELKWNKQERWHFKKYNPNDPKPVKAERAKIVQELQKSGIEEKINQVWRNIPRLYSQERLTMADRKRDALVFKDMYFAVDPAFIGRYYKSKGVHYINISGYGLYHFGADPANTGCSLFAPKKSLIRIRIKSRKSSLPKGYGFLGALRIGNLSKSNMDLNNTQDIVNVLGGFLAQKR